MDYRELVFALNRIGIALGSETKLQNLFNLIVDEIIEFADCDACSLYIKEEKKSELIFQATKTLSLAKREGEESVFKSFSVPIEMKSIAGYTAITGETVNIEDCYNIQKDKSYDFNKSYDIKTGYRTVSMLSVPMKDNEGNILGVIQLINKFDKKRYIVPFLKEFEEIILSLASQAAVALISARLLEANKNLYKALVEAFSEAIEARSPHTAGHSKRVAYISNMIAVHINAKEEGIFNNIFFSDEKLEELKYAALLHDVGKVAVPENVLEKRYKLEDSDIAIIRNRFEVIKFSTEHHIRDEKLKSNFIKQIEDDLNFVLDKNNPGFCSEKDKKKINDISNKKYIDFDGIEHAYLEGDEVYMLTNFVKGNFSPEEWEKMKRHVINTLDILETVPFTDELKDIPRIAGAHHEMLDGSGYPNKIHAEGIMLQSRILAVADVFEALTASDRPYKKAIPVDRAKQILSLMAKDGELDKEIVDMFINDKLYMTYIEARDNGMINA
ncbi:MAG: GAF domain-containing protein [Candidatus Delongbacteria bacterium]|nr:GAF domain-containing protein [Candidatus Delongbacteria bacterium]